MTKHITPEQLLQQISSLLQEHPELKEDDEGWQLAIESETDVYELLRQIERERQEAIAMAGKLAELIAGYGLRQSRFEKREQARRLLAFRIMQLADITKAELPEATMSLRSIAPSVIITHEDRLPDDVCQFIRRPDKAKIKELLLTGPVPGATLSNGGMTISIRVR